MVQYHAMALSDFLGKLLHELHTVRLPDMTGIEPGRVRQDGGALANRFGRHGIELPTSIGVGGRAMPGRLTLHNRQAIGNPFADPFSLVNLPLQGAVELFPILAGQALLLGVCRFIDALDQLGDQHLPKSFRIAICARLVWRGVVTFHGLARLEE
ncbi:hypothetical protein DF029_08710 [Burkholderia cepacia]|nr:hypothetical protein DF029_08710 [Burkholderia cepacia]